MGFWDRFRRKPEERDWPVITLDDWARYFAFGGGLQQTIRGEEVQLPRTLQEGASFHMANPVVFACMGIRQRVFSEARFAFRRIEDGRPGELWGGTDLRNPANRSLALLSHPWPNAAAGDLWARAISDVDLAGNAFFVRRRDAIWRARPDWMTIVLGSDAGLYDAEVIGYLYHPSGKNSGEDPIPLQVEDVAHWAPIPDPTSPYRGMSWLNPLVLEVSSDEAAMRHKLKFFENGGTSNLVITLDPAVQQAAFETWVDKFESKHAGVENAYRNIYLGGGADAKVIGANFEQMTFKVVQGHSETRIAAAAGVPAVIAGISEGLQGSSLNAGNYTQSRRQFADGTMRPLWRHFCGAISTIVEVPPDSELWYDDRDIPFLQDDRQDAARTLQIEAETIDKLVASGFTPNSAAEAVTAGDLSRLSHTGLVSVQLQKPGEKAQTNGAKQPVPAAFEEMPT